MVDPTSTWTYASATVRQSRGSSADTIQVFSGLPLAPVNATFQQYVVSTNSGGDITNLWIGLNSTTVANCGNRGTFGGSSGSTTWYGTPLAACTIPPFIGINNVNSLESMGNTNISGQFNAGTEQNMVLKTKTKG